MLLRRPPHPSRLSPCHLPLKGKAWALLHLYAKLQFKTVNFSKILALGVAVREIIWYNAIEYIMGEI
jgi:hypothetical protein